LQKDNKLHSGSNYRYRLRIGKVLFILVLIAGLFSIPLYLPRQSYEQSPQLPLSQQLVLSSRNFFDPNTGNITEFGQNHSAALPNFDLNSTSCPNELAIYVHGIWADEQKAEEQYNRLKDSYHEALKAIDPTLQPMPVVLYSWDSNTAFDTEGNGWSMGKGIANNNGQFLANSILNLSNECNSNVGIHVIAHSLGARIVLNALADLNNNTNFKLESVHLMGAVVDDEEVSNNPSYNSDSHYDDGIVYGGCHRKECKEIL
jgi:hypothetical protein